MPWLQTTVIYCILVCLRSHCKIIQLKCFLNFNITEARTVPCITRFSPTMIIKLNQQLSKAVLTIAAIESHNLMEEDTELLN